MQDIQLPYYDIIHVCSLDGRIYSVNRSLWDLLHHHCITHLFISDHSPFFGTKVVNTELHKALPALAVHVDHICVEALQVLPSINNPNNRNSIITYNSNNLYSTFMTF